MMVPALAMAKKQVQDSGSGCLQNLAVSGNFSSGKQFLASTDHEGVSYAEAFSKTIGGKEATAGVTLRVEQLPRGTGNQYRNAVKKAPNVPEEIFDAIEQAITNAFGSGIQFGYPCADVGVTLIGLDYSELTSTPFAFASADSCLMSP